MHAKRSSDKGCRYVFAVMSERSDERKYSAINFSKARMGADTRLVVSKAILILKEKSDKIVVPAMFRKRFERH